MGHRWLLGGSSVAPRWLLGGASAAATRKRGSGDRVHRGSSAHGGLTPVNPPAIKRSISASSDDSHYGIKSGPSGRSKRSIGATFGNDSDGQGSSAYPTQRRITAMKKPAFVPTPPPAKKAKKGWSSWFCPCYPGRRGAERDATSANARFERQRLLAEEGRLPGYGKNLDNLSMTTFLNLVKCARLSSRRFRRVCIGRSQQLFLSPQPSNGLWLTP